MPRRSSIDPLFDEEPRDNSWMRYALIGAIVVIVGFILYAALAGRNEPQGPVPVIRADETPWTRQATETGGMEIPNQDSTVFELMEKKDATEADAIAGETPPEEAAEKATTDEAAEESAENKTGDATVETDTAEDTTAMTKNEGKESDVIGGLIEDNAETKGATTSTKDDKTVEKDLSTDKVKEEAATKKAEEDKPFDPKAATVTPKTAETKPASSGKTVQVRLGSVPGGDKTAAAGEFKRLQGLAGGALSGASPSYESVNLDGKGSFVRINVSMDEAAANKLCDTLSSKGAPCLVLH